MYKLAKISGVEGLGVAIVDESELVIGIFPFVENAVMVADILNQIVAGTCVFVAKSEDEPFTADVSQLEGHVTQAEFDKTIQ
jgi:hypothetical protein